MENIKILNNNKGKHFVFLRRLPKAIVWGGLEKIIYDWFKQIDYGSCRATLVVSEGWKEIFQQHFMEKGVPADIVEFPFDFSGNLIKDFRYIHQFLKRLNPSVIILVQGDFYDHTLATVLAGFLLTSNHVYMHENLGIQSLKRKGSLHFGFIPGIGLWYYKQYYYVPIRAMLSRKIITLSQGIKDQLMTLWGYSKEKVIVLYHGIDLKQYHLPEQERRNLRKNLNIPLSDTVFIMTCRLAKEKCVERAIEAFDQLAHRHRDVRLLIIGDGDLRDELQKFSLQKINNDRILFLGYQHNIPAYLKAADCYINSSDNEGLCISLLEAMASGLVCIATDCAGPTELIQNSRSGFLTNKNVEGVLEGMRKAVSLNKEERKDMVNKGILFVNEYFNVNRLVKVTLDEMGIPNKD